MKKKLIILFLLITSSMPVYSLTFGTYKPESEYGLIDGFKFQIFNREKGDKVIQLKSDTKEEKERLEKIKENEKNGIKEEKQDDYQMYKFMLDDTIPL